jgi:hypothetical protein
MALTSAKAQQLKFDEIDVADDVAQQGRATAPQSEITPAESLSPILRRGHGGASPQLRYVRKETDNSE